jgi:DNA-binding CsgD family transcriptional regulator
MGDEVHGGLGAGERADPLVGQPLGPLVGPDTVGRPAEHQLLGVGAIAGEEDGVVALLYHHSDVTRRVARERNDDHVARVCDPLAPRERAVPVRTEFERSGVKPGWPLIVGIAAKQSESPRRVGDLGSAGEDLGVREVMKAAGVIGVQVRHHDLPYITPADSEVAESWADLLLWLDPLADGKAKHRMPAGKVAWAARAGGLARIDDDHTLRVLDRKRVDRKRFGEIAVDDRVEQAPPPVTGSFPPRGRDRDGARLNCMDSHTPIMRRPTGVRVGGLAGLLVARMHTPDSPSCGAMGSCALDGGASGLVGRDQERRIIERLLEGVSGGESGSLVVRAEAGIGKTSLLRYAADRAKGMTVLRVTGVEAEADLDFAGVHSLVRPIVAHLGRLPGPQREALAAALGLAPSHSADRFLVSAGVLSLLAAAAEGRPVVCLIDDAQWLDVPSADALVFTARRLGAESVGILFAAREGERRRFEAPGLEVLHLSNIDGDSAATLLGRAAPGAVPWVRERLLSDAAGNPLALLELPAALSGEQLAGRASLPETLPLTERLCDSFMQRIRRLPEPTQAALLIAAAEDTGQLRVIDRAAAELGLSQDALDPAEEIAMVRAHQGKLTFRHPLVRSAVYESATPGRRRAVHAALAQALTGDARSDRALWHRALATAGADEEIAGALETSARGSQQRGGHASAASAFERAAELSEAVERRGERLALAAEAAGTAGQVDRARTLIQRSLRLADRSRRSRLLFLKGAIDGRHGWLKGGVAALHEAAALSDGVSLTLEILREACAMTFYAADYDAFVSFAMRARELACETDADRFTVATLTAAAAEISGDHQRGSALSATALQLAPRLDDPICLVWAAWTAARELGAGQGLRHATRAVDIARERGLVGTLAFQLQMQAEELVGQSRFDLAYSSAEEGFRLALDIGQPWAASWNLSELVTIDALRGAEQSALTHAEELRALVAKSGATLVTGQVARALGLLALALGRPGKALDRLLDAIVVARYESHPLFVLALPDAVEAAVRSDRLDEVAEHVDRFRSWVLRFPSPPRHALLARCRALLDDAGAEHHFSRALEFAHALSPFDRARCELLYGEWLRRRRRRVDARQHLRAALELFVELCVAPWEARARAELRASGETARKRDPSLRDQLTPQELQIARLVATGKSNPEIAAQLFLSPRTIDYHLRKVFAKLEISARAELARVPLGEPIAA